MSTSILNLPVSFFRNLCGKAGEYVGRELSNFMAGHPSSTIPPDFIIGRILHQKKQCVEHGEKIQILIDECADHAARLGIDDDVRNAIAIFYDNLITDLWKTCPHMDTEDFNPRLEFERGFASLAEGQFDQLEMSVTEGKK